MSNKTNSKGAAINMALLLSAIVETGNTPTGNLIGKDAAFVSRLKTGEKSLTLDEFAQLIAGVGLELAPIAETSITIERELFISLNYLARLGLASMQTPIELQ
ncbi:hypothetical protein IT774_05010 [Salinimonas marina]|uniref:Uncharacterized protein n=1 Tax=Salinimonas marina TaxID=2785918 RepID=A0A7S9DYZ1_9ALTE|nr:hypothetical protein [Salinimonas marina]QPG06534.1 hypothetical protein IT774_05010 [Salinimonas marina]